MGVYGDVVVGLEHLAVIVSRDVDSNINVNDVGLVQLIDCMSRQNNTSLAVVLITM